MLFKYFIVNVPLGMLWSLLQFSSLFSIVSFFIFLLKSIFYNARCSIWLKEIKTKDISFTFLHFKECIIVTNFQSVCFPPRMCLPSSTLLLETRVLCPLFCKPKEKSKPQKDKIIMNIFETKIIQFFRETDATL